MPLIQVNINDTGSCIFSSHFHTCTVKFPYSRPTCNRDSVQSASTVSLALKMSSLMSVDDRQALSSIS